MEVMHSVTSYWHKRNTGEGKWTGLGDMDRAVFMSGIDASR